MSEQRWLAIVGIGADGVEGLAPAAARRIAAAGLVVGGARHLALAAPLIAGRSMAWPSPLADAFPAILAERPGQVAVLASGDPFWFGVGPLLTQLVPGEEIACFPAPSAFALASARLGWALQDVATLSCCGRPVAALVPLLQPRARVLVLSEDATTPAAIAALATRHGFGDAALHVLERLGGPDERCRTALAGGLSLHDIHPLNVVALQLGDGRGLPLASGLGDAAFEHDGQITKQEIRAVTLAALAPRRGELLWDIGCGSGSVAIEWMLRHHANRAVAVERDGARAARARGNAQHLGVPGLRVVEGSAPDALAELPRPDAVFVGGGGHQDGVIGTAWDALRPGGRMVVNAVTVETEMAVMQACRTRGGTLTRLAISRLDAVGGMHAFRPAMTVTQWAAVRP